MEQFIQKKKGKMGAPYPLSVKLCEKRPMPTSQERQVQGRGLLALGQPRAASMSRAVLLRAKVPIS